MEEEKIGFKPLKISSNVGGGHHSSRYAEDQNDMLLQGFKGEDC